MAENFLADTFAINNRINLYLLSAIADEHLTDTLNNKGRNVGEQFAHIHNVRLMWLKVSSPEALATLTKFEKTNISKPLLSKELEASGKAVEELLTKASATNKIKGFKPHAAAFMGYLISHESHHRGQIMLILKSNNHMVDQKTQYGLWEWGVR